MENLQVTTSEKRVTYWETENFIADSEGLYNNIFITYKRENCSIASIDKEDAEIHFFNSNLKLNELVKNSNSLFYELCNIQTQVKLFLNNQK